MTTAELLADFNRAIDVALFDAGRGDARWLRELAELGAKRAQTYPTHKRGFLAAARRARKGLPQ